MGVDGATPPGLWERVRKIAAEEVAKFAKSGFLRNARITGGGGLTISGGGGLSIEDGGDFRVRHPNGVTGVYAGDINNATTGAYVGTGLLVQDPNSEDILIARTDAAGGFPVARLIDGGQNLCLSLDSSGQGLGRPYLPGGFYRQRPADWPVVTSGTFEGIHKGFYYKQQPRLQTYVQVSTEAATTAEVRIMVEGVQIGATKSVAASTLTTLLFGPDPIAGAHMDALIVEVQARRVSGTGLVRVEPLHMYGRQS